MLQCAAVQMMSSPPAACCSECDARPLQREDGGRNEWEGRGAAIGEVRTKHNCDETVTLSASYSLVYSLVTVRERGHGPHPEQTVTCFVKRRGRPPLDQGWVNE